MKTRKVRCSSFCAMPLDHAGEHENEWSQSKPQHTPTPWKEDEGNIVGRNGRAVALTSVYTDTTKVLASRNENSANAAFIVRAVNSHEELLAALRQALWAVPTTHGAFETVRQAVAKAEQSQAPEKGK